MVIYNSRETFLAARKQNIHVELTQQQKDWALGLILSDGWVKGQWLYLAQSTKNLALVEATKRVFGVIATDSADHFNPEGELDSEVVRLGPLPEFAELGRMFYPFGKWNPDKKTFYPVGGKIMPPTSWLNNHLNEESLAVWIMGDGSIKSKESKGIEIHTQGLPIESAARGAISIFEKTNITCKISLEKGRRVKSNKAKAKTKTKAEALFELKPEALVPVIFVCGENIEKLISRIKPRMEPDLQYKIPPPRKRAYYQRQPSDCEIWYTENKNQPWREEISSCIAWRKRKNEEKLALRNARKKLNIKITEDDA